jgi:CRISPR/Cas system Type II protein with McrA/HNH and RuvC-like nuclease domain
MANSVTQIGVAAKRKSISTRTRFDIFKRDSFTCQYCGQTPPKVILEVDHIVPVCKGGDSDEENLITACFDCNRGKAGNPLSDVPQSLQDRSEQAAEAEAQIQAYSKMISSKKRRVAKTVKDVEAVFKSEFGRNLSHDEKRSIQYQFIPNLPGAEIIESMSLACFRMNQDWKAWKYFCGICWTKIKGSQDG